MNIEKEISKFQGYELFRTFQEIKKFRETGILDDGFVREYARKYSEAVGENPSQFLKFVEGMFLYEMAKRYCNSMEV